MSTVAVKKVKLGDNADTSKNFLIEVPAVADGTLTIKRENGTSVLSIDSNGKAVIPGVVGTVAQVGGVPTGQVVERGSNANGDYIRFADGTQICVATRSFTDITTAQGSLFISQSTQWYFPATFVGFGPTYTGADARSFGGVWACSGASPINGDSCSFSFLRVISYSGAFTGHLVAIGRWY